MKLTEELAKSLTKEGYIAIKEIEGRGICAIFQFIFTTAIVFGIDKSGYKGRWCYGTSVEAISAYVEWNGIGDPPGEWITYKGEGGQRWRQSKQEENGKVES